MSAHLEHIPATTPVPAPVLQLRALVAADWHPAHLTDRLGWDVVAILHGLIPLTPVLVEDVATLYDRLAGRTGNDPTIGAAARTDGWKAAPPLPDSDDPHEMAIGYRRRREAVGLTRDERVDAVRRLAALHLSDTQIGEAIGLGRMAVSSLRQCHRIRPGISPGRPARISLDTRP